MESARLALFFRNVSHWPKNLAELDPIASALLGLLETGPVFVWLPGIGLSAVGKNRNRLNDTSRLQEFIQSQIDRLFGTNRAEQGQAKQTQLAEAGGSLGPGVSHFTLLPILEPNHINSGQPPTGREIGWIGLGSDRMMNGKTELLLIAAAQHLAALALAAHTRQMLAQRDQFLSIASHELKTPLTSIYGILQLQQRMTRQSKGAIDPEKQASFLKITVRQVERLNELIDGLLDVSRIQNGRFMVEPSENDAVALLTETVSTRLRVIAQEAGVQIQTETPTALLAWIDPVRFEETITNLGMNAIRFSPEGGVVWIRLRAVGDWLVLSVRDQGPSLPESDRDRIFQPFERAQRTSRLGGLGLGLYISRQIAQLHGGSVVLSESEPGTGNLFEARFPLRRPETRRASA